MPEATFQAFEVVSQYDMGWDESFWSTSMVTVCDAPGSSDTFCHPTRRFGGSLRAGRHSEVDLRDFGAGDRAGIGQVERDLEIRIGCRARLFTTVGIRDGERGVGQPESERK